MSRPSPLGNGASGGGRVEITSLAAWYASREERERKVLLLGALALAVAVLVGIVFLDHSVSQIRANLARRERDLAWMRSVAPELAAAGPAAASLPASQSSLIVIVDRDAHEAGLGAALTSSAPASGGGLRVRLEHAPFDTLVGWLDRLADKHGIRVASAAISDAGAPGLVNATLVLHIGH